MFEHTHTGERFNVRMVGRMYVDPRGDGSYWLWAEMAYNGQRVLVGKFEARLFADEEMNRIADLAREPLWSEVRDAIAEVERQREAFHRRQPQLVEVELP